MTWANHSNHSNHSLGGEFGHPGGASTPFLCAALDDLGMVLSPDGAPSGTSPEAPAPSAAWRALNRRHRHELLVAELTRGLTVAGDRNSAEVRVDGAALLTIDLGGLDVGFWAAQVDAVRNMKGLRRERMAEILAQVGSVAQIR